LWDVLGRKYGIARTVNNGGVRNRIGKARVRDKTDPVRPAIRT
jgi:hypothetical protein